MPLLFHDASPQHSFLLSHPTGEGMAPEPGTGAPSSSITGSHMPCLRLTSQLSQTLNGGWGFRLFFIALARSSTRPCRVKDFVLSLKELLSSKGLLSCPEQEYQSSRARGATSGISCNGRVRQPAKQPPLQWPTKNYPGLPTYPGIAYEYESRPHTFPCRTEFMISNVTIAIFLSDF